MRTCPGEGAESEDDLSLAVPRSHKERNHDVAEEEDEEAGDDGDDAAAGEEEPLPERAEWGWAGAAHGVEEDRACPCTSEARRCELAGEFVLARPADADVVDGGGGGSGVVFIVDNEDEDADADEGVCSADGNTAAGTADNGELTFAMRRLGIDPRSAAIDCTVACDLNAEATRARSSDIAAAAWVRNILLATSAERREKDSSRSWRYCCKARCASRRATPAVGGRDARGAGLVSQLRLRDRSDTARGRQETPP